MSGPDWINAKTCVENARIAYDDAICDEDDTPVDTVMNAGDLGVLLGLAEYALERKPTGVTVGVPLEYPCAPIEGVGGRFVPVLLRSSMAARYCAAVPDLTLDQGMDAALATWDTDWDSDPAPRTIEAAIITVDGDLECWGD